MMQLPLLASSGPEAAGTKTGPDWLLQGPEGAAAGFSGELQAMLMQMSPQMLRQLEELLAGGMTLPQAARSLLAEAGLEGPGGLFGDMLEDRLPAISDEMGIKEALPRAHGDGALAKLASEMKAGYPGSALGGPGETLSLPLFGNLSAATDNPAHHRLSPQLAANLLEMGVPQQVGGKGWGGAIADRIMWMVQGEQQFARLQLNPPNLGPLEVRVSVHQDQTSVAFLAQHAAVREALEAALPRLREMFDQQSLQLVRADVSDPGARQGGGADDASAGFPGGRDTWAEEADEALPDPAARPVIGSAENLVDLFA